MRRWTMAEIIVISLIAATFIVMASVVISGKLYKRRRSKNVL